MIMTINFKVKYKIDPCVFSVYWISSRVFKSDKINFWAFSQYKTNYFVTVSTYVSGPFATSKKKKSKVVQSYFAMFIISA